MVHRPEPLLGQKALKTNPLMARLPEKTRTGTTLSELDIEKGQG